VQFLVLSQGCKHPELLANAGNIALLQRAQACGLLPAPVGEDAAQAYRVLRQIQHRRGWTKRPPRWSRTSVTGQRARRVGVVGTRCLAP
jgi:glutamate-ammonia-ligase adenylyltransferase